MLLLLERADNPEEVVAILHIIISVLHRDAQNTHFMRENKGYDLISSILRKKGSRVLCPAVVGAIYCLASMNISTNISNSVKVTLSNLHSFFSIALDWTLWRNSSTEQEIQTQCFAISCLSKLLHPDNPSRKFNAFKMRDCRIVQFSLTALNDEMVSFSFSLFLYFFIIFFIIAL